MAALTRITTVAIRATGNDEIPNNFKNEIDEGLWGYVEVKPEKIGLPVTVFLDVNAAYKHYHHPPCLYVANSYMSYDELIPVGISPNPDIYMMPNKLGIHRSDLFATIGFIGRSHENLAELADEKIDYRVSLQRLRGLGGVRQLSVDEMPIIRTSITGLPLDIWIGEGEHGAGIGFQSSSEPNPRKWASITLPDIRIVQGRQMEAKQNDVNQVVEFARLNCDNLLKLVNREIDCSEFMARLITFDQVGNIAYPNVGNVYLPYTDGGCGFTIVRNDLGRYNYINNKTQEVLVVDGDSKPVWLDTVNVFREYNNGLVYAYVELNNDGYFLTTAGQLHKGKFLG